MRTRATRVVLLVVLASLLISYGISIIHNVRHRDELIKISAALKTVPWDRIETAAREFAADRKTTDKAVNLRDLLSTGYLKQRDVAGLADKEVVVSVTPNEKTPEMILVRVRASNGSDIVLMGDGSIQQTARQ
ncbi:MAG: hypothetical protein ACXWC8_08460 [Limisphaerales bacterium]